MSLFEIILLGYIINFTGQLLVFIISFTITMYNMSNTEFMIQMEKFTRGFDHTKLLRKRLKEQGKSKYIQEDFTSLIPYSGVIVFLDFLWIVSSRGLVDFTNAKIEILTKKLTDKLNK